MPKLLTGCIGTSPLPHWGLSSPGNCVNALVRLDRHNPAAPLGSPFRQRLAIRALSGIHGKFGSPFHAPHSGLHCHATKSQIDLVGARERQRKVGFTGQRATAWARDGVCKPSTVIEYATRGAPVYQLKLDGGHWNASPRRRCTGHIYAHSPMLSPRCAATWKKLRISDIIWCGSGWSL